MFDNPDFFPTPAPVIHRMLEPFLTMAPVGPHAFTRPRLAALTILEPSAGSGAILDWITDYIYSVERGEYGRDKSGHLYACESDPDLKAMLQGKHYKVIADDFLAYAGDHQFDLIVLNPPFSAADKHVLHAFRTVAPGGQVVALVNSETLRNPYTETRRLLARLIGDHGSSEELGACFLDAERRTDVAVSLVRLQRPAGPDPLDFGFTGRTRERDPELKENSFKDAVALRDVVGNMMTRYAQVKSAFVDYMKAREALAFYGKDLTPYDGDIFRQADRAIAADNGSPRGAYNAFSDQLKQGAWRQVLSQLGVEKFLTAQVLRDFESYRKAQGYQDFTRENVAALVELLFENRGTILEKAVESVFETFTAYHKENRCHVEGWKTNAKYKVNRKIILPHFCEVQSNGGFGRGRHGGYESYGDIDKVMCYLTATNYDELGRRGSTLGAIEYGYDMGNKVRTVESAFFEIKCFKKGTCHLTFLDERLWQEFNLRACAGKQWLPEAEHEAYRRRKRSPFDPEPAPVAAPAVSPSAPKAPLQLAGASVKGPVDARAQLVLF